MSNQEVDAIQYEALNDYRIGKRWDDNPYNYVTDFKKWYVWAIGFEFASKYDGKE